MEFKPFVAPESHYAPLNNGIGEAAGVSPKGLVEGINAYFKHLFAVLSEEAKAIDDEARKRITELEDIIADLQMRLDNIEHPAPTPKKGK